MSKNNNDFYNISWPKLLGAVFIVIGLWLFAFALGQTIGLFLGF
ncbi:hypothetical protein [Herbidospora galbida]|nr:hypothetical protein [Herbidospora galbida]